MINKKGPQSQEFTLPFVGREEELQFLLDEYDQMLHAQYRSVWIEAPAGMGKTTLVEEFLKRISVGAQQKAPQGNGVKKDDGMALSAAPLPPLQPWIVHAHLRERSSNSLASFVEALGVTLQTLTEAQREKLFSGLTSFYKERAKKIVGGANAQSMDMEEAITTAGYILKQLSKYFPLVVVIEDIHVLKGEMSFYALRHLQAIVEQVPVLTMFISRPSEEKYLKQFQELWMKEGCKKYEVKSLKYEDVEKLVGGERTDAKRFMQLSGGNALLLRELLRRGTFDSKDSSGSTTETIIHYLTKELEQLSKRDRQVIAIAGMLGEEFSEQLLQEITGSKDFRCWSDDVLRRLEQKGIIMRRKKILKPEGEGAEISLRVSVFSHALWWEAARKLYDKEKTWTDRKFAETIIPLLSQEDYPLLTDAELIVKLFQWLPRRMSFALLEYVHSLCSSGARWHFHTEEETVKILAKARNCIVDLMARTKSSFTKDHIQIMARLLDMEKLIALPNEGVNLHIVNGNHALIKKLLSPFLESDPMIFEYTLSTICDRSYIFFHREADEHLLKLNEKDLQSLRPFAIRHHLEQHRQALLCGIRACEEWYRDPSKAAGFFYRGVRKLPRTGWLGYNYTAVFLEGIANLPFSQTKASEYLLLATHFRKEATRADAPNLAINAVLAYWAEISLALRAGKIAKAREQCEELFALKEKVRGINFWRKIQFTEAKVCSYEGDRDNAMRVIEEIFSKFSWRDDTACLKSLAKIFLTIEEWRYFEKLWQENKHHLWPPYMIGVIPLVESRLLMCLLLGNDEGIREVRGMLTNLRKNYPMMKESIKSSEKKTNLFLSLKTSSLAQAKKEFETFIASDDTMGPFDKAFYLQLFARIGVQYGHAPKEFSTYVKNSLEGLIKLEVPKRVVFTAERLAEVNLLSSKELKHIKKKYVFLHKAEDAMANSKSYAGDVFASGRKTRPVPSSAGNLTSIDEARAVSNGVTLHCLGCLSAFTPDGHEIVKKYWGKRQKVSDHKRVVIELVRAKREGRIVSQQELLTTLYPEVIRNDVSKKKLFRLTRKLAAVVSQLKVVFAPYVIFEKDGDGYQLSSSVCVDLLEAEEMTRASKKLFAVHLPSALWLAEKAQSVFERGRFGEGMKTHAIAKLRNELVFLQKENNSLLCGIAGKTGL